IATKGGLTRPGPGSWVPNCRPEYLSQCVDKSLKRLKLERIDVYQLHTVDRKVPIDESVGALKAAPDAGKIRHVRLSNGTTAETDGHVANPGNIIASASRGEYGCRETSTHPGRLEED